MEDLRVSPSQICQALNECFDGFLCPFFHFHVFFLTSRYSCLGAVVHPHINKLKPVIVPSHHRVPGLWWFCIVTVWHPTSSVYNFVEILLRQVVRLQPHEKTFVVFLWSLESPHFPFPMQILKKAAVKLSPILLKQHIAASWVSAIFFPDLWIKHVNSENPVICAWITEEVHLWEISW